MRLIFDAEATGLDVTQDKVHCVVSMDYDTGDMYEFRPHQLDQVAKLFCSAEKLIAHKGISYDLPILENNGIIPTNFPDSKIVDTLVLSRLYYPDREGGHSVGNWGERLGYPKVVHEDWSEFTEDMINRCRVDVEIQAKIYKELLKERGDHDWSLAEKIEHQVERILFEQEQAGWQFRTERAKELVEWLEGEMERIENEVVPTLPMYYENKGEVKKPFKQDGNYTKQVEDWTDEDVGGPFGRIEWQRPSLSQRQRLAEALIRLGWKPSQYTDKGSPKITPDKEPCPNLEKLGDVGKKLAYYFLCAHRRGQIQGWVDNVRENGRLPSIAIGNSTNTGRMAHRIIANVPKASENVFMGPEMRDLFTNIEGRTLVGWDAEGLEMRVLAHFMDDPDFTKAVVNGKKEDKTDIHNVMLSASKGIIPDRDTVKNCVYAFIYGAGDHKLGQTAGYTKYAKARGKEIRQAWMNRFPKLEGLVSKATQAAERGYLIGIDGRKVWMRRDPTGKVMSHKGLNTLIQSTGSIIIKLAVCYLVHMVQRNSVDAQNIIIYHDEDIAEVLLKDVDRYKEMCYASMKKSEERLGIRCPLGIEVKTGESWREVH